MEFADGSGTLDAAETTSQLDEPRNRRRFSQVVKFRKAGTGQEPKDPSRTCKTSCLQQSRCPLEDAVIQDGEQANHQPFFRTHF